MRTVRASPRWPEAGERFGDGWEWLATAFPMLEALAHGAPIGADRADEIVTGTLREIGAATAADALALLVRDDPHGAGAEDVPLRRVVFPGPESRQPGPIAVPVGRPIAPVLAAALGGSVAARVAVELPLASPDETIPVGWLLALFAGDDADARAAGAVPVLEQVGWPLVLAFRGGWEAYCPARARRLEWPGLDEHESALCRAALVRTAPDGDATGAALPPRRPAPPPPAPASAEHVTPRPVDENVQFTVYRPRRIPPETWCPVLAFAHLAERRADAPVDAPDPIEEVRRQARQVLGEEAAAYADTTQDSGEAIPREGEITFALDFPDLQVNPGQRSFRWLEDVHREEFRVKAPATLDGRVVRGALHVYLGALLVAEVVLAFRVDAAASRPAASDTEADRARPYRRIFPSYSHRDEPIVRQVEAYARTMGDEYLRDVTHLRSGERWNDRLMDFIRGADVFQLFWSRHSMVSPYVRQEWEYALSLGRPHFVRPTYWETPMPEAPDRDLPPSTLRALHFQRLPVADQPASGAAPPPATVPPRAEPAPAPQPPSVARPDAGPATRRPPRRSLRIPTALAALFFVGVVGGTLLWQQARLGIPPPSAEPVEPRDPDPSGPLRALSPDGELVASMDVEGRIRVASRNAPGGAGLVIATRFRPPDIERLRFSPDGRRIVCELRDGTTVEWDVRTGTRVAHGPTGLNPAA